MFDPALPTEIIVDASATHIGAVLIQRVEGEKPVVIAYWSRALNDAERKYSSQEREMLAICKACATFRHYLMGAHFKVRIFSDHKSLSQIKLNKIAANRVGRWNMLMSEFDTAIYYLAGPQNHLGDFLSRAVELDSDDWERRGPGADTEDKFAFPFLHAWPEVAAQVQTLLNVEDQHMLGLLYVQDSAGDESFSATFANAFASVDYKEELLSAQTQLADEFADCLPENAFNPFERALLGFTQHSFSSKLTFEESQYLLCPDFGAIYRKLKYPKIEDRDAAVKAATKEQKAACSIPTPKNRQRVARTLPKNVSAYELENGILYYRSPMYGSVTRIRGDPRDHFRPRYLANFEVLDSAHRSFRHQDVNVN